MLSAADNERMCRVGPGTPMGNAQRRYWIPALLGQEIAQRDSDPVRVELLGETFVAFRDTEGRIGFLDEACCHRGASLALGRVEECGIRCLYHGWKYAYNGEVLETPNVADPQFKTRFKARAYPTREAGGVIWVYLGPLDLMPRFPTWRWLGLPKSNVLTTVHYEDCNFVQVLEGLVDSTHVALLHADALTAPNEADLDYAKKVAAMKEDLAPSLECEDTAFGFHYAALRKGGDETQARVAAFIAPFTVLNPNGDIATIVVPASDTKTIFFHAFWSDTKPINEEPLRSEQLRFVGLDAGRLEAFGVTRETFGQPHLPNRANNFLQDRAAMRAGRTFTGLPGLILEDVAVCVSAGHIRDRSKEMLSASDVGVSALYKTLLKVAKQVETGKIPPGLDPDFDDAGISGATAAVGAGQKWQTLVPNNA